MNYNPIPPPNRSSISPHQPFYPPRPPCPPHPGQPCPCEPHRPGPINYWQRIPGVPYRPPMNHQLHTDKYFYTVLFLDNYFNEPMPECQPRALTLYYNIFKTFDENSLVQWEQDASTGKTYLVVNHKLHLPVTLELWDEENKSVIYAPVLKENMDNLTVGRCIITSDTTIKIDFTGELWQRIQALSDEEKWTLGIKQIPTLSLPEYDNVTKDTIQVLENFNAVPHVYLKGLALVFRRNSLEGLYDLIADFDDTYFKSMENSADLKYLVKKSAYKDVHFSVKFTDNLQDVIDLINVDYYKVEYSWEDHKRYKDQFYRL